MNWLLPAQTLLDLIAGQPTPAQTWAGPIDLQTLRVSVVSIAQARAEIMRVSDVGQRMRSEADLSSFLAQLEADAGPPLPFIQAHASVWAALMHEPTIAGVPQTDRQVYATAMHEGLTVVETAKPPTGALQQLGVLIHVI